MRNEIKKVMETLKDKECNINVQSGSSINEMSFIGATVDCDEKRETINITTQLVCLSLNVDNCIEVNVDGNEVHFQFDDGLEFEILSYTKEEFKTAHEGLFKHGVNESAIKSFTVECVERIKKTNINVMDEKLKELDNNPEKRKEDKNYEIIEFLMETMYSTVCQSITAALCEYNNHYN